jgi:acetoin utilization deacetylase AcuC-like enzyme
MRLRRLENPVADAYLQLEMRDTGFILDRRFMEHNPGQGHPERPERIGILLDSIAAQPGLRRIEPRLATPEEVTLVHDEEHFARVAATSRLTSYAFDADTPVCSDSFETACLAAGGVLALLEAVMAGEARNGFAFVRPPGHHAEPNRAMGFCLFNNVAIGAAYLRKRYGLDRILIMDWDVHHGNGTQDAFERDPGVLYVSTHRYPFYPGTGALDETGSRDGEGFTVNIPMVGGFADAEYLDAFQRIVEPIAMRYEPDFVIISAGFDPHALDPLGGMGVSEQGFAMMARSLLRVADASAAGRCVAVLEGGYNLRALRDCSARVLDELRGNSSVGDVATDSARAAPVLDAVRRVQGEYWRGL